MTNLSLFLIFTFAMAMFRPNTSFFDEDFVDFFNQHYPSLCFFANRYVKDKDLAEDVVSDSIIKVWEKRNLIECPQALKNYTYTTVRNDCLRWLEKEQQLKRNTSQLPIELFTEETALQNIIRTETIEKVYTAIKKLPPKSSEVFRKLYVEGKTVAETAGELKVTISTVKSHKRTGLALLRNMLSRVLHLF